MPRKQKTGKGPLRGMVRSFAKSYIPDREFITFRYADEISAAASSNQFQYQWNGNGPYDPNSTGVGAQPVGFDQWSNLYQRIRVVEVCHDIWVATGGTRATAACAFVPTGLDPGASDFFDFSGMRRAVVASTADGAPMAHLRLKGRVDDLIGADPGSAWLDDEFGSTFSALPGRKLFMNLAVQTTGATDTVNVVSVISYKAVLEFPLYQSVSRVRVRDPAGGVNPLQTVTVGSPERVGPVKDPRQNGVSANGPQMRSPGTPQDRYAYDDFTHVPSPVRLSVPLPRGQQTSTTIPY